MHSLPLLAVLLLPLLLPARRAAASPTAPGAQGTPTNLSAPLHISGNCTWSGKPLSPLSAPNLCLPLCPSTYPTAVYTTNTTSARLRGEADDFGSGPACKRGEKALCCEEDWAPGTCHVEEHNSTCLNTVFPYTALPSSSSSPDTDPQPDTPLFLAQLNSTTLPNCTAPGATLLLRDIQVWGLYAFNNGHTAGMWMTCASWAVRNLCCGG
ncbi:hypothetical protein CALCODRAFT_498839 [Calocera cornea HHB12733]|uniref:Uncharacterized protein n=1 Tax=Calocera cornea HHB12733 TaxID=1353952 RepID=A0A165ENX1_9BASI|nr:hypothetical protein CALCODRAFT_498839 [Calocera cornea HHB12733]